ncbi:MULTISPECIES: LysR substrate-binding domain-containing protein [unclassified Paenibacillus]|uniref:LysR substrate-binding domain-containing protein n=1 Tax=unclassified Paenibacillus TaxID=185978 RepID=UPI001AE41536|nr:MULTISPECIES: LysR substrate-binding domain-containing protein [unclassified Paenibacillus]MBP1156373.1 DNA-binding transcriptional LysR family regulator [Paenibacillus sp. PvP091]MBP1168241.1 DNA-binding transcriptional LysR family regulator [Paenibacillus sp. PvR098]MBP2439269.1 DNA-binding transcriptional LysR family regulator [Paenibacillus sp. PvP052]
MDIDMLKAFQTAAFAGTISKAAQQLGYAQSNITTKIRQLENDLGTPLFYRHNRGITLTSAGKTLLEYAGQVLRLVEEARKAVTDGTTPTGSLSIGSMETTAAVRLPELLAAYHRSYPEVNLSLVTGPTEQLVQAVLDYELDGAFVAGPVEHPDLLQESFIEEELMVVTQSTHPPLSSAKELNTRTVLAFRAGCSYRAKMEQWLHEEGVMPVKILEFGTLETILGCVAAGLGVSLLPRSIVQRKAEKNFIRCHPIPDKHGYVWTVLIRRKDAYVSRAYTAFTDEISAKFVR